jgi:hypothetical protein
MTPEPPGPHAAHAVSPLVNNDMTDSRMPRETMVFMNDSLFAVRGGEPGLQPGLCRPPWVIEAPAVRHDPCLADQYGYGKWVHHLIGWLTDANARAH